MICELGLRSSGKAYDLICNGSGFKSSIPYRVNNNNNNNNDLIFICFLHTKKKSRIVFSCCFDCLCLKGEVHSVVLVCV